MPRGQIVDRLQVKFLILGEQLVRNGLARSYGFKTAPPGLTSSRIEVEKLQQFEDEAKREKIGAWGMDAELVRTTADVMVETDLAGVDSHGVSMLMDYESFLQFPQTFTFFLLHQPLKFGNALPKTWY